MRSPDVHISVHARCGIKFGWRGATGSHACSLRSPRARLKPSLPLIRRVHHLSFSRCLKLPNFTLELFMVFCGTTRPHSPMHPLVPSWVVGCGPPAQIAVNTTRSLSEMFQILATLVLQGSLSYNDRCPTRIVETIHARVLACASRSTALTF